MSGSLSVFTRELKLAWSGGGGAALPVGFFFAAGSLTPFAVGNDISNLQIAGPGVMQGYFGKPELTEKAFFTEADVTELYAQHTADTGQVFEPAAIERLNEIIELADTVTEMTKVKHAFNAGVPAQRGIED